MFIKWSVRERPFFLIHIFFCSNVFLAFNMFYFNMHYLTLANKYLSPNHFINIFTWKSGPLTVMFTRPFWKVHVCQCVFSNLSLPARYFALVLHWQLSEIYQSFLRNVWNDFKSAWHVICYFDILSYGTDIKFICHALYTSVGAIYGFNSTSMMITIMDNFVITHN